jgi:hypothetical protein
VSFVDGLLNTIKEKGSDLIVGEGGDWAEKLIEGGRDKQDEIVNLVAGLVPGSESITGDAVDEVLDVLEANSAPFVRLTSIGFAQLVGYYDSGEDESAKNFYMATKATYAERRAWIQLGGDLAQQEREAYDKAWSEVKDVMEQVGRIGLKILLAAAKLLIGI